MFTVTRVRVGRDRLGVAVVRIASTSFVTQIVPGAVTSMFAQVFLYEIVRITVLCFVTQFVHVPQRQLLAQNCANIQFEFTTLFFVENVTAA